MKLKLLPLSALALFSMLSVSSFATLFNLPNPTPETPGLALDANTLGLTGTVVRVLDVPFSDNALLPNGTPAPFATGLMRSFAVDRGGALDFYYQLVNTTQGQPDLNNEFFRLTIENGFSPGSVLSVGNTNTLAGLTAGAGSGFVAGSYAQGAALEDAATADRGVTGPASIGFDFPTQPPLPFIGDPRNVGVGEASNFLVVRTNTNSIALTRSIVSGAASSFPTVLAAIPEPTTILMGLALASFVGCTELGRKRRRAVKA
jgi:hypothetical protein